MKRTQLVVQTYLALIGAAQGADLSSRHAAPPLPPPPVFLFEGFYAGAQVGAQGFADRSNTIFAPTNTVLARRTASGGSVIGGLHAGYDWHGGPFVFGLRGDVSGAHVVNAGVDFPGVGVVNRLDAQGSLRGRVGYAFGRFLVFASGGLNVAHVEHNYRSVFASVSKDHIVAAPTVGLGAEYAIDDHWRAHVEYRVSGLSTGKEISNPFNPLMQTRHDACSGAATVGVSYRFGR